MKVETEKEIRTYPVSSGVILNKKTSECEIGIIEDIYHFQGPFCYPSSFCHGKNAADLLLKAELIKSCSTLEFEKEFHIGSFLSNRKNANQQKTELKKSLVKLFDDLAEFQRINKKFQIFYTNGSSQEYSSLSLASLKKAEKIVFWEELSQMQKTIRLWTNFDSKSSDFDILSEKMVSKRITFYTFQNESFLTQE
jgi:hypothetical protein